jgi:alkanesulfonate monooxygenase SsuD/methylene tetrahydromethanopterin reductase-like flavin-dependent oxidoreductase (luciferase family)
MRFGLQLPTWGVSRASVEDSLSLAEYAEDQGFDSIWVGDHLIESPQLRVLGGEGQIEALTFLGALSARIRTVKIGTCVLIPIRSAVHTLVTVATLCALAPGRIAIGFGVGGFRPEFDALGLDFDGRGSVLDQTLRLLREWPTAVEISPVLDGWSTPPRPERPPELWIGGSLTSSRTRERVLKFAEGWFPPYPTVASYGREVALLRTGLQKAGRPITSVEASALFRCCISEREEDARQWMVQWLVPHEQALERLLGITNEANRLEDYVTMVASKSLVGNPGSVVDRLKRYEAAGMTHVVVSFVPTSEGRRSIELFARDVMPAFSSETLVNASRQPERWSR